MYAFSFNFDFYEIVIGVALAIMCLVTMAVKRSPMRKPGGIGQPLANPIVVILPIVFFTMMAAMRTEVGDTVYYVLSFNRYPGNQNPVTAELFFTEMFTFFQNLIRNLTEDSQWLLVFSAVFSTPVPLIILYKYSYPFEMSLILFVLYGYFGGILNGMRQYMATAIVLLGTRYLFSEKKTAILKYAVLIMLAWSMHNSALIMLPIFIVVRRKSFTLSSYILLIGSVCATVAFDAILPSFLGAIEDTSYGEYSENGWFTSGNEGGANIGRVLIAAVPIVIAFFNRDRLKMLGNIGDILANLAFLNVGINMIATYNWLFSRLSIYLMIYYIIFAGWVVWYGVQRKDRAVYCGAFMALMFLFSRTQAYQIQGYVSDYFFPGRKLFR